MAEEIKKIAGNFSLGLVFGAGNIYRGRSIKGLALKESVGHYAGMTATLVNGLVIKNTLDAIDVPARIISSVQIPQFLGVSSPLDLDKYFALGETLIFSGGTGNPFVSTDTAAVIRALEIKADFMLKATNVKGIYDRNPKNHPEAAQFKEMSHRTFLELKDAYILDRSAAALAEEYKLPSYVFKWETGALKKAVKLRAGGTLITS